MSYIQYTSEIPFLAPVMWNLIPHKDEWYRFSQSTKIAQVVGTFFFSASDIYFSDSKQDGFDINFHAREAKRCKQTNDNPTFKFLHYLRLFTGSCLALCSAKALSHAAVKIWKEQAPQFVHLIQKAPTTILGRSIHAVVLTGAATAALLIAVKIVLRYSLNFEVAEIRINSKPSNSNLAGDEEKSLPDESL